MLMMLRRLVRARLGVPLADDFFTDDVLDDHINLAIQHIESENHWPWSDVIEQTLIGPDTADILLPLGYRATRALFDAETELHQVAPADLLSYTGAVGELPRVWCPMGAMISVRPAPATDTMLTHYWYRQPAWLSRDIDVPAIPDQFTGAIIAKAAELMSSREGAGADTVRHRDEYEDWVAMMRHEVRRTTTPTRVRVRPGGWI